MKDELISGFRPNVLHHGFNASFGTGAGDDETRPFLDVVSGNGKKDTACDIAQLSKDVGSHKPGSMVQLSCFFLYHPLAHVQGDIRRAVEHDIHNRSESIRGEPLGGGDEVSSSIANNDSRQPELGHALVDGGSNGRRVANVAL